MSRRKKKLDRTAKQRNTTLHPRRLAAEETPPCAKGPPCSRHRHRIKAQAFFTDQESKNQNKPTSLSLSLSLVDVPYFNPNQLKKQKE
jgi:hypothetical protein